MIKVDNSFYVCQFLQDAERVIPQDEFKGYVNIAMREINAAIFNKEIPPEHENTVKMCCCELAQEIYRDKVSNKEVAGKTSEKVGSYSVTYESSEALQKQFCANKRRIIHFWLAETGLLFAGV